MHSTQILKSADFMFMVQDQEVEFTDLIPNFSVLSRLGIVSQQPSDGIGASNLIMACVTEFYNFYRHQNDFFTYPDYFSFQTSNISIDYSYFDIWPSHKNLQVERKPEKSCELSTTMVSIFFLSPTKNLLTTYLSQQHFQVQNVAFRNVSSTIQKTGCLITTSQ